MEYRLGLYKEYNYIHQNGYRKLFIHWFVYARQIKWLVSVINEDDDQPKRQLAEDLNL